MRRGMVVWKNGNPRDLFCAKTKAEWWRSGASPILSEHRVIQITDANCWFSRCRTYRGTNLMHNMLFILIGIEAGARQLGLTKSWFLSSWSNINYPAFPRQVNTDEHLQRFRASVWSEMARRQPLLYQANYAHINVHEHEQILMLLGLVKYWLDN